jgi:ribosomal protein S18 acetylase RimI-like enzyme
MTITYRHLGPADARQAAPDLIPVYAAVFSLPPYDEEPPYDKVVTWIDEESEHSGFTLVVACDGECGPVGFTYGYTMVGGSWFGNAAAAGPAYLVDVDKAAVMEWAVVPDARGQGIGRELMRRFLDGRSERYAVLTVNPAADARAVYERAGWQQTGITKPGRNWPAMHIMALDLAAVAR